MNPHTRQTRRAWLGAGIILLLIVIGTFVFMLDPILAKLRDTYTLVVVLPDAPQLGPGSPVWVSGREVGEVTQIGLMPAGGDTVSNVALHVELPAEMRELVRGDSEVRITSARMIGEPVIDIARGTPAAAPLDQGDTLRVAPRPDAAQLMARAALVQQSLDTAVLELRALQGPAAQRMAAFQQVQARLALAQREYAVLTADLRSSPALAVLASDGMQTSLTTVRELVTALQGLQQRAEDAGVMQSGARLRDSAARLQTTLRELEAEMNVRGGTVDRLLRDSALVRAIAGARAELDSLIADAKRNPLRYVF